MTEARSSLSKDLFFDQNVSRVYDVVTVTQGVSSVSCDHVAEEVPIALVYNGISHAVMLATPQDLQAFALGFSLTEGIIDNVSDVYGVDEVLEPQGIALYLEIASHCFARLKEKRRNLTGRTGCGLCGSESLTHALRLPTQVSVMKSDTPKLDSSAIHLGFKHIREQQKLQLLTGATHASAWVNLDGEIVVLQEDVGRHNALDKLIGTMANMELINRTAGYILTTSRASVEMVQKAITAGVSVLVAVSAPTGLAIRVANIYGLTLIGFAREARFVIYTHPERVIA